MPAHPLDYPTDDKLVKVIERVGSISAAARELGYKGPTLVAYIRRTDGLHQLVEDAKRRHLAKHREPEQVTDPERLKAEERDAELKLLRKNEKKLVTKLMDQEAFFDRIIEHSKVPVKTPNFRLRKVRSSKPRRSVVIPIYDCQYGSLVKPEDTPTGVGSFSTQIFDRRLRRWVDAVTGMLRDYAASHTLTDIHFVLGGDLVEGDEIFPGQSWQLEADPARQVWDLGAKLADAISEVVRCAKEEVGVPKLGAYAVPGNHGKVGGKRSGARPSTYSWDWLTAKILKQRLSGHPIDEFAIEPGGALFFGAAGHIFLAVHGDEIRGWGGLPFYGLARFDGRMIRMRHTIYHYLLMGHHHQPATIPNGAGEHIVSGDWVGGTQLSRQLGAASRPQQCVLFVSKRWGIVEHARVHFTTADEATAPPTIYGEAA